MTSVGSSKPREPCQQRRHSQHLRQPLRDAGRADVVGDVPIEVLGPEAKRAIWPRDSVLSMVAEDDEALGPIPVDAPVERALHLLLPQPIELLPHGLSFHRP